MPNEQSKVEILADKFREADAAFWRARAATDASKETARIAEKQCEYLSDVAAQARKALVAAAREPRPELPDAE